MAGLLPNVCDEAIHTSQTLLFRSRWAAYGRRRLIVSRWAVWRVYMDEVRYSSSKQASTSSVRTCRLNAANELVPPGAGRAEER